MEGWLKIHVTRAGGLAQEKHLLLKRPGLGSHNYPVPIPGILTPSPLS